MKQLAKAIIRYLVFRAPWGVREALLDACIDRIGIYAFRARFLPKCHIIEVGAAGDRGVVTSSWNDTLVLPEYGATGTYAETVTATLVDFFRDGGGTYMDIGANIGLTTIPLARMPNVRCLAFEPEPGNFDFLTRNVARNAAGGMVELHQKAVFETRGALSLAVAEGNIGDHRLTLAGVPGRRVIEIPAVPLDDFQDRISGRLALKIDTQGAEPFVVAGGRHVFAKAGLLVMEFCPYLMRQLGGDPNVVIDLVAGFDRVAVMTGGRPETPDYAAPARAQAILREKLRTATDSDGDYLDIIAVRDRMPA